jgi:hypothetical protein
LPATSRLIVDGARPKPAAMTRPDAPAARLREISSRSANDSRNSARQRGTGRIPPVRLSKSRTVEGCRRIARANTFTASPDRHRRHTSSTSAGDNAVFTTPTTPLPHQTPGSTRCCDDPLRPPAIEAEEANYGLVVRFLECVQHLASHRQEGFLAAEDVMVLLGPRCTIIWKMLTDFWERVAAWSARELAPLEPTTEILSVENEQLRAVLWTSNRTLPGGHKLGLAHALRYEKAGGIPIPAFSQLAAALDAAGPPLHRGIIETA